MSSRFIERTDEKSLLVSPDVHEQSADGPLGIGKSLPEGLKISREQVTAIITGLHSTSRNAST